VNKAEYAERCKQYESNSGGHGIAWQSDGNGAAKEKSDVLTDEEKNKRMDETRRQIKAFCRMT
jgi:hypothetical protein